VLGALAARGVVVVATGTVVIDAGDALVVGAGGGSEVGDTTTGAAVATVVAAGARPYAETMRTMSPAYAATKIEARALDRGFTREPDATTPLAKLPAMPARYARRLHRVDQDLLQWTGWSRRANPPPVARRRNDPMSEHEFCRDRAEIVALINRYAELLDSGRLDEVAGLFELATWRASRTGVTLSTPDEVRAVYRNVILYDDGTPRTRHLLTNVTIDVDDTGVDASSRCYFTVLQGVVPGEPIEAILSGRYEDRFAKGPDGWHFTDRLFHADLIGDQSRHFRGG
jgi:hypothetical protein